MENEIANIDIVTVCESASGRARKILYHHISIRVLKNWSWFVVFL